MWIVNGDTMPPRYRLLRCLGPLKAQAVLPLTGSHSEQQSCQQAYQRFLDQAPPDCNVIYRFAVEATISRDVDGPVLTVTYRGQAGIGRYLRYPNALPS